MKKFIVQSVYILGPILFLMVLGLFLPSTPHARGSLLFGNLKKDSLLEHVRSPRIVLVGGSNLSFGINSQMILDSLGLNPINTGVTASLGLKYMLDNTLQYVKKGDVIVLVPEYPLLTEDYNYGSEELFRSVVEVNCNKLKLLNAAQVAKLLPFLPKYALSKFVPTEYVKVKEDAVYGIHSFNRYGDTYTHWDLPRRMVRAEKESNGEINRDAIDGIKSFKAGVESKNAIFLISYCCLQDISYDHMEKLIKKVEAEYVKDGFDVLGSPERYRMPDSLTFNTPYHLNKKGADYRTSLLIEDLEKCRRIAPKAFRRSSNVYAISQ